MRVALDLTVLTAKPKGAGRVMGNLARFLPSVRPDWTFVALAFEDSVDLVPDGELTVVSAPRVSSTRWDASGLRAATRDRALDALVTHREAVSRGAPPTLLYIAEPPHYRLRARGRHLKWLARDVMLAAMFRSSIRRAAWLAASSPGTARWVQEHYGVAPAIIPPGIEPLFLSSPAEEPSRSYLLHIASGDARENTELVVESFARSGLHAGSVDLVIAGVPPELTQNITRLIDANDIHRATRLEGWVSDEELLRLYAGALALVHPSRYEGFLGLQALEAMAQRTPVIVLEAPGVPRDAPGCLHIAAEDAEELAALMRRVAEDRSLALSTGRAGERFARTFEWSAIAERFAVLLADPTRQEIGNP